MKVRVLRAFTVLAFAVLVLVGLIFNSGFDSLSSFGFKSIAEICPVGALESMLASKTLIPRVIIGFLVFTAVCVVLGRFFCSWLCPVPSLRKAVGSNPPTPLKTGQNNTVGLSIFSKEDTRNRKIGNSEVLQTSSDEVINRKDCSQKNISKVPKTPFVILGAALASAFAFGFPVFCIVCPVGLTFAVIIGLWSMVTFNEPTITLLLIAVFLLIEIVFLRKWCHQLCPIGAVISLLSYFNKTFTPKVSPHCLKQSCGMDCNRCRDACPEGIDLNAKVSPFLMARCSKCHACAEACPVSAIHFPFFTGKKQKQEEPSKLTPITIKLRTPDQAIKDFSEVAIPLTKEQVIVEASRCIDCGACETACPQHTPVRKMMAEIRQKHFLKAGKTLLVPGAMPEICGRICPQEELCQSVCPLSQTTGAIRIGALTSFCADYALKRGLPIKRRGTKKGKIGIVGAGPAGLAAADSLRNKGFSVSVFEGSTIGGGLLEFGIPSFKLPKSCVENRMKYYKKEGIDFHFGTKIESTEQIKALCRGFDAVLWAAGATQPVVPKIEGIQGENFFTSDVFLKEIATSQLQSISPRFELKGKRVAILGAGDSAMDCARSAIRLGASSAICIARKKLKEVSAHGKEVKQAEQEGVVFIDFSTVTKILRDLDGHLSGVQICNRESSQESVVQVDFLVSAWGFRPKVLSSLQNVIKFNEDGTIKTDHNLCAGGNIFVAGDAVLGADLVTDAVAQGRYAAECIEKFLEQSKK